MSSIIEQYETLISLTEKLQAELIVQGNVALAESLFTVEEELIWQLHELG